MILFFLTIYESELVFYMFDKQKKKICNYIMDN